jgi:uncharacterized membrane protein YdjX (TVP38/TMEM64 family)
VVFYALGLFRYFDWDYLRSHLDDLQAYVGDHLALAIFLYLLAYVAATALSIPIATGLTLLGGALFGRWLATLLVAFASSIGATLAMLASRYLFRDSVQRRFANRLEAINRGLERDGAYYLFGLRLTPVIPFFLINLGIGLTRMRAWTFFAISFVGMLPGIFLYANAGTALAQIESPKDVVSPGVLVSLALLGIAPLIFRLMLRRIRIQ